MTGDLCGLTAGARVDPRLREASGAGHSDQADPADFSDNNRGSSGRLGGAC